MTGPRFLVDTNVISELFRPIPNPHVVAFVASAATFSISVMVLHELQFGLEVLNDPNRRAQLAAFLARARVRFSASTLPVGLDVADAAARLRAAAKRDGRVLAIADALIAATGLTHGLILATRNVKDFAYLDVPMVNPFEPA